MKNDSQQRPWTPPRVQLIYYLCVILILCNIFDALTTVDAVLRFGETELNPLMRTLLKAGPGAFVAFKIISITILALFLGWASRKYRIGWIGLRLVTAVYFINFLWQALLPYIGLLLAEAVR